MQVGDRIRVFEVVSDLYRQQTKGKHLAEARDCFFGNSFGVNLVGFKYKHHHIGTEARQVCTMVITKIK